MSPHRNNVFAVVLLCTLTGACAQIGEQVPVSLGGLPSDVPQRPQAAAPTPAVHDVPPARATPALNEGEQLRLEKDLAAARARQEKLQDPNARQRGDNANAASAAARERAKAAAKPPSN